ncbi:MAG TPA: RNase adapter RapZ [Myxococcota bacterium]|nr:RNase adapter RapZ [Myxococcota bacterium]
MNPLRVVFVSGLSGSGKSTAMNALEDIGFYCVDNLPAQLTSQVVNLCAQAEPPIERVALAIDAREERFLRVLPSVIDDLRRSDARVRVLFLDCATDVLVDRYRETRRVHPLSPSGSVEEGIARERELLGEVARLADLRLDSSDLTVHELRRAIADWAGAGEAARGPVVNLVSFGFRHGLPRGADLVFDVRFLPNPHFEPLLRPRTGLDADVAAFVLDCEPTKELLERLRGLLNFLLPLYEREGKSYLTVAVGCTGGRHRSVAVLESLARELRRFGQNVSVTHRDVEKD